jgi:hypothetical protein
VLCPIKCTYQVLGTFVLIFCSFCFNLIILDKIFDHSCLNSGNIAQFSRGKCLLDNPRNFYGSSNIRVGPDWSCSVRSLLFTKEDMRYDLLLLVLHGILIYLQYDLISQYNIWQVMLLEHS